MGKNLKRDLKHFSIYKALVLEGLYSVIFVIVQNRGNARSSPSKVPLMRYLYRVQGLVFRTNGVYDTVFSPLVI